MRYLYYILAIVVLMSLPLLWSVLGRGQVNVSKPEIIINDRIISHDELEQLLQAQPHDKNRQDYMDSIIMKELLIQEAIRRKINKEEGFRRSVENFYEQSLIKILLDRQYQQFNPEVSDEEIQAYRTLSRTTVTLEKTLYPALAEAQDGRSGQTTTVTAPFDFLADQLKFILLGLKPGEASTPVQTMEGFAVYRLQQLQATSGNDPVDDAEIRRFITDRKKELLYDEWTESLRKQADIRRF